MISPENQSLEFTLRVNSAYKSHLGRKRKNNEDYAASYEPSDPKDLMYSGCLYIVADGVGGASKGEKASKYATEKVMYEYFQHPEKTPEERLRVIIRKVGLEIFEFTAQSGLGQMATTMVTAVIRGNRLSVANVGDSRAYLIRDGISHQITRDHNQLSELLQSGAISIEEGRKSKIGNILTRSVGGHDEVDVDVFMDIELFPGDIVILCSDGLHKYLGDVDIASLISGDSPVDNAQQLVDFANQSGGNDNITALVVHINSPQSNISKSTNRHPPVPPESLDTMRTEIRFTHNRGDGEKRFQWGKLLFLLPVMMVVVILWFFGGWLWNVIFTDTSATPTHDLAESVPVQAVTTITPTVFQPVGDFLVEITPAAEEEDAIQPGETASPTPQPSLTETNFPVVTPTLETGNCAQLPQNGEGITSILFKYAVPYMPDRTYEAYQNCDSEKGTCSGKREIKPGDHDSLGVTEFLLIDGLKNKDKCLAGNGLWITIFE